MYPLSLDSGPEFQIWEPEIFGKDSCGLAGKRAAAHCEFLHKINIFIV